MDIKTTLENAVGGFVPAFEPVSVYEATMIPDASFWCAMRRAREKKRSHGATVRQKRLIRAMERDAVDQLRAIPGAQVYELDQTGARYPVTLLNGVIRDELRGVVFNLPQRPRDHLAIVIDLISFDEYLNARNAEQAGNGEHFREWETMASMFAQSANVSGALLLLLCPRTGDLIARIVDRDDDRVNARMCELIHMMEIGNEPPGIRAALGPNPVSVTCRTCWHCNPVDGGRWSCMKHGIISEEQQSRVNPCHIIHPDFIPLELLDDEGDSGLWFKGPNGEMIEILSQEEAEKGGSTLCDVSMQSIEAAGLSGSPDLLIDQNVEKFKRDFGAKLG